MSTMHYVLKYMFAAQFLNSHLLPIAGLCLLVQVSLTCFPSPNHDESSLVEILPKLWRYSPTKGEEEKEEERDERATVVTHSFFWVQGVS